MGSFELQSFQAQSPEALLDNGPGGDSGVLFQPISLFCSHSWALGALGSPGAPVFLVSCVWVICKGPTEGNGARVSCALRLLGHFPFFTPVRVIGCRWAPAGCFQLRILSKGP